MKMLRRAALPLLAVITISPLAAQVTLPQVRNSGGANVPTQAVVCVDLSGNYTGCGGGSGIGSDGAVTAASGAFAAGSIIDLSSGGLIDTDLKGLLKSGQTIAATQSGAWSVGINGAVALGAGSATIGAVTQAGSWNIGSVASITNPIGLAAGSATIGAVNINGTVPVSGTFWQATQPISAASLPLPSGAATAAGLTTINTTLGSPFQAGGLIGNTTFGATQSGAWNLGNITGTVSLPTGASTSALQTTGNSSLSTIASELAGTLQVAGTTTSQSYNLTQMMAGKCFIFAIPLTSAAAGNDLNIVLSNPTGSGETFIVMDRRFSQTTGNVLLYTFYTNPTAITGTTKSGVNELTGSAVTSALTMTYNTAASALSGTSIGSMPIPPNGQENPPQTTLRTIPPGSSIGYSFGGTGGFLAASASFTFTLEGCKQ